MTDFGKKLYDAVDRTIKLYDSYGMASDILLTEQAILEVVNRYSEIEQKLAKWQETRSLSLAAEICEELCRE